MEGKYNLFIYFHSHFQNSGGGLIFGIFPPCQYVLGDSGLFGNKPQFRLPMLVPQTFYRPTQDLLISGGHLLPPFSDATIRNDRRLDGSGIGLGIRSYSRAVATCKKTLAHV